MSRLTTQQYLEDRAWLASLWWNRDRAFGVSLTARQQWDLHAFYAPAEDLDDAAATAHRLRVTTRDPSLPQRAGRAIRKLRADAERLQTIMENIAVAYAGSTKRRERGPVIARGVVNPRVDPDDVSRALLKIMRGIQDHYERKP